MARNVKVVLIDDIDGGDATQTINFSLDGLSYEIGLSDAHAKQLRDAFAEWVGHGRRITGRRTTTRRAGSSDAAKIRAWAKVNGRQVPQGGRIPNEIRQAYEAANK